jgi:hypothetical protein
MPRTPDRAALRVQIDDAVMIPRALHATGADGAELALGLR